MDDRNPDVRVRFAPSPTGYLHIGGARTALYNWLFARCHGGTLVLRVEDTDRERSTPEATQAILDGMRFLGLDWDEGPEVGGDHGPYFQAERAPLHAELVERLVATGNAYRCFCTKDRLGEMREQMRSGKLDARGFTAEVRSCDQLDDDEVARRLAAGEAATVRFKVPEGQTVIEDLIRGRVEIKNEDVEDFIIARADGTPVYNLAVVGDDHGMAITHVIRGEDHLSNTAKQILLFEALGFSVPLFAHISLILAPGGGKLSKRHGAVSVIEYEEKGFLPEAMINFLVRMGWSFDDKQEIFSREELIEKFSLDGVSKSGAVYDIKKLENLGGHYMRERPLADLVELATPRLVAAGFVSAEDVVPNGAERQRVEAMVALEQERMNCLEQIVEKVRYYFVEPTEPDKGARKALRKKKDSAPLVARYVESLEEAFPGDGWGVGEHVALEEHATAFLEKEGVGLGDLAQPLRAMLTGRGATPGLFDVMAILGKETCVRRVARIDEWIAAAQN
jgi:glutamyl-tRNA synthetase